MSPVGISSWTKIVYKRIVAQLDGLPLAIELAAARIKVLAPRDLRARLEHRLSLLTSGPADDDERHRTMRSAIAWSHELLTHDEKALFRHLGVFRGGFCIDASVAVAEGAEADIVDGLDSLLSKSLLVRPIGDGTGRFSMLELVREFAVDQLAAAGEVEEAAARHARYYTQLATKLEPDLSGDDPGAAVERLRRENDNLRGALQHALAVGEPDLGLGLAHAMWRYWQSTGQLREGRQWLEELLSLDGASEASRAKGYTALAGLAYWQGDFATSSAEYARALELYRAIGDRAGEADALYGMSLGVTNVGRPAAAEEMAREARSIFIELGAKERIGQVLMAEASAAWRRGELERTRALWEDALRLEEDLGDQNLIASELVGLAAIVFLQGELGEAVAHVSRALEMTIASGNAHTQLFALDTLASVTANSRPAQAVRVAGAVKTLRATHGGGWTLEAYGIANARTAADEMLSPDEIEQAWAEGAQMSLEDAIEAGRRLAS